MSTSASPLVAAPLELDNEEPPRRPEPTAIQGGEDISHSTATLGPETAARSNTKKRRNHRAGKKKRARRQSFAASTEDGHRMPNDSQSYRAATGENAARASFYRLQGRNSSSASMESEALLDHRDQQSMRPRRQSTFGVGSMYESPSSYRPQYRNPFASEGDTLRSQIDREETDGVNEALDDERAPLISTSSRSKSSAAALGYGGMDDSQASLPRSPGRRRLSSKSSFKSDKKKNTIFDRQSPKTFLHENEQYNVNYPPSMPGSPRLSASRDMSFGDLMVRDEFERNTDPDRDDVSENAVDDRSISGETRKDSGYKGRRHTIALEAEEDVCFPTEGMSEMADEDMHRRENGQNRHENGPRRRRGKWPDLSILEEWSRFEKESRSEERRTKKITEPKLIGGRLRPVDKKWHRVVEDEPYRFTYFNEEFQSTIHSLTISELVQPGSSFRELFIPDPPELSDSSESEDEESFSRVDDSYLRHFPGANGESRVPTRQGSVLDQPTKPESKHGASVVDGEGKSSSRESSGGVTPNQGIKSPPPPDPTPKPVKPKRYGDRPTFWLDVLSPTEAEMKVLSKTFGIHPLTAEDILMQEAREKVELFRNYYFVNYRTFEQDIEKEDFLEPVNMYVVVFREGVISFHFSLTPHPSNVRRRIRQLKDYLLLTSDWISYAIIDDITDAFAPLIQSIEDEVDDIDDAILKLHSSSTEEKQNEERSGPGDATSGESGGDMLRRVGDCRKKVMGLYRLLGNKADVIKGFAKRCNEHWDVAPRSEIGLYLGDIQDHIVTMTGNLSHYEKILARSHGNYLAQINIRMNERQEQTADVLGKLTVLGTIVLPMNIITGLWGMNVWVPGQQYEGDLTWFMILTAGLLVFGMSCFFIAKLAYKIV